MSVKNFDSTYLYNQYDYNKKILNFIMKGHIIDKTNPSFEDIRFDVKRRNISNGIVKVLDSNKIVLICNNEPLPEYFKVLVLKDPKDGNKKKVFIDCSSIIFYENGKYECSNINILVSYIVSAMTSFIYINKPTVYTMNNTIIVNGATAFASLFTYIIDYMYKISVNPDTKSKCMYISAYYYLINILGKDPESPTVRNTALKVSKMTSREADIIDLDIDKDSFKDINTFITSLNKIFIFKSPLTTDAFIAKWIFLYKSSALFALELFPSFATMMTNAYIGSYINNQKTIEKVAGSDMVQVAKTIINYGINEL